MTGKAQELSGLSVQSGCRDLNSGPLVPQTSALTRLRHTPKLHKSSVHSAAASPQRCSGEEPSPVDGW
jgi:hypothetical protein